jgi:hypothetical protein
VRGRNPFDLRTVCRLAVPRVARNHPVLVQEVKVACRTLSCPSRSHAGLPNVLLLSCGRIRKRGADK